MKTNDGNVMLVNMQDQDLGLYPKLAAHKEGLLHRAFSIFIFNSSGQLLLQKRADCKYHSPGLWTNTCCSHPLVKSNIESEARKRLEEEMGFTCSITFCFKFIYNTPIECLIEHELDYVYIGIYDGIINPNLAEVTEYKYVSLEVLEKDLREKSQSFTEWFKICYPETIKYYFRLYRTSLLKHKDV
jgi:isopentenyl-diphosphate Delta-isomerase